MKYSLSMKYTLGIISYHKIYSFSWYNIITDINVMNAHYSCDT